jgi:hypothetical protein
VIDWQSLANKRHNRSGILGGIHIGSILWVYILKKKFISKIGPSYKFIAPLRADHFQMLWRAAEIKTSGPPTCHPTFFLPTQQQPRTLSTTTKPASLLYRTCATPNLKSCTDQIESSREISKYITRSRIRVLVDALRSSLPYCPQTSTNSKTDSNGQRDSRSHRQLQAACFPQG